MAPADPGDDSARPSERRHHPERDPPSGRPAGETGSDDGRPAGETRPDGGQRPRPAAGPGVGSWQPSSGRGRDSNDRQSGAAGSPPPGGGRQGAGGPDSGRPSAGGPTTGARVDTEATTAGLLPDGPGLAVLGLVTVGIVALGVALGYGIVPLALLCGTGALGALGVRVATREGRSGAGVALLWVAAFAFAALSVVLMGQSDSGFASLLAALCVASAALLAPFAVLGSTVRLYGHGAGRRVVRRYVLGTLLLGGIAVALLVGSRLWSLGWDILPPALTESLGSGSLAAQVATAVVVYGATLVVGVRVARALPMAVVVEPGAFDRVLRAREVVERGYYYGLRALAIYVVTAQVGLLVLAGSASETEALRTILRATAPQSVVAAVGTVTAVLAGVFVVLWLLRSVGGLTRAGVASVVLPSVATGVLAVVVSTTAAGPTGSFVDRFVEPSVVESFLVDVSPWVFVGLLAVLFLACAFVFGVPTLVAGQGLGDESLAGVASAGAAVVLVVVVAVLAGRGLVVVAGVALATVVWEFGEFATVASGELAAPSTGLPDGFGRLASVHAVATLAVTGGAVVFATLVFVTATASALSTTVGAVVVVLTGVGIAALTLLLNG
jgi:hypothetical protein